MAVGTGFSVPVFTFFYLGQVAANGSVYVYQTGTTTPVTIYADSGLITPLSNPLNLDANGQCKFYVSGAVNLRLDAYTGLSGAGTLIESVDPVYPVGGSASLPGNNTITDAMLAQANGYTWLGNPTGGLANKSDNTMAQLLSILGFNNTSDFRLTLTSGTPVTTSDVTAATTLYFTPYKGSLISLYDGTSIWATISSAEMSIAVPATTSQMYDVFCYNNSGVPTLELLAWTNDTARATALVLQNGVYVKSGATTRRYVGSFRTTGVSGQTEDSNAKRYVWNMYNRVVRNLRRIETTASWTYSTNTLRQANAAAANQLDFVRGLDEDAIRADVMAQASTSAGSFPAVTVAIGLDSTTTAQVPYSQTIWPASSAATPLFAYYTGLPGLGRHTLVWLEASAQATTTWVGNSIFGIIGLMLG